MRSYWFKVGSDSMTGVIIRRGTFGNMEMHKEESHVTRQAEIGELCLRPSSNKDCRQPPEAKRGMDSILS